jgi:hypothetical protein
MIRSIMKCFRRSPRRAAATSAAAPAAVTVPKVIIAYTPAWVVKSMMAAGGLVCVGVLVWLPVYADTWGSEHGGTLIAAPAEGYTPPFDLAGLNTGPGLFPVVPSGPYPTGPMADLTPRAPGSFPQSSRPQQPGHAGHEPPVTVPEPGSLAVFLAGVVGLVVARRGA